MGVLSGHHRGAQFSLRELVAAGLPSRACQIVVAIRVSN
jgi:hypothetical protein